MVGSWANYALPAITGWFGDITVQEDYMQAKCYKVMSCDARDSIIKDHISLKSIVAHE